MPAPSRAQSNLWSGIISPSRAINWTGAGIPGGLPDGSWTQCGATIAPYGTSGSPQPAAEINNALTSCGSNQYLLLGPGSFYLSTGIIFPVNTTGHLVLRGSGANSTFLFFSGSASGCNAGQSAFICYQSSDSTAPGNTGVSVANWTGGYAQGSTQITLNSISGIVAGKTLLVLNQCDTGFSGSACTTGSAIDNGGYFVCSALYNGVAGCSVAGPDGTTWRTNAWQTEIVQVTAVNPGGCGSTCVSISQPIEHPNWSSVQSPQAVIVQPISQDGIENLTIDGTAAGSSVGAAISLFNAYQCWVSGVKIVHAYAYGIYAVDVSHSLIQNNYLYASNGHPDAYAVRIAWGGDDVVQNNIFEQWKNSFANDGPASGEVIAYNFSVNQLTSSPSDFMWGAFWTHSAGDDFMLREGNASDQAQDDNVHGSHLNATVFRNFFWGWESCANGNCGGAVKGGNGSATAALIQSSNVRYSNVIGNVFGTSGFTKTYMTTAPFNGAAVYTIGAGGTNIPATPFDALAGATEMFWGNYDVVTGAVRWCGNSNDTGWSLICGLISDIPTAAPSYPNSVPILGDTGAGQSALPASFYLTSKPSWFGSNPWPAIGPDVSGGDVGQCTGVLNTPGEYAGLPATSGSQCKGTSLGTGWGGHVNANPAMACFFSMGGVPDGTDPNALPFNPTTCYGNTTVSGPPSAAASLNAMAN